MQLFLRCLDGTTVMIDVAATATIRSLKQAVQLQRPDFEVARQSIFCCGKPLADEHTLDDYNLGQESVLHLVMRAPNPDSEPDPQPDSVMRTPDPDPNPDPNPGLFARVARHIFGTQQQQVAVTPPPPQPPRVGRGVAPPPPQDRVSALLPTNPGTPLTPRQRHDRWQDKTFRVFCQECQDDEPDNAMSGLQPAAWRPHCSNEVCPKANDPYDNDFVINGDIPKASAELRAHRCLTGKCGDCKSKHVPVKDFLLCKGVRADGRRCQSTSLQGQCAKLPDVRLARRGEEASLCMVCNDSEDAIHQTVNPNVVTFAGCDCILCIDCFVDFVSNAVNDPEKASGGLREAPSGFFSPPCPQHSNSFISDRHTFKLLGRDMYDKMKNWAIEDLVNTETGKRRGLTMCPLAGCPSRRKGECLNPVFILPPGDATKVTCPTCKHSFCRECRHHRPWPHHELTCECDHAKEVAANLQADIFKVENALTEGSIMRCPTCRQVGVKNDQCIHISKRNHNPDCKGGPNGFCYGCGNPYHSASDPATGCPGGSNFLHNVLTRSRYEEVERQAGITRPYAALRYFHLCKSRKLLCAVKHEIGPVRWEAVKEAKPRLLLENFGGDMWGGGNSTSIGWDSIGDVADAPTFPPFK